MNEKTLILSHYGNKLVSYNPITGPGILSNELGNLFEEYNICFEKRKSLFLGIKAHKKELVCDTWDEFGTDIAGEPLFLRGHYTIYPSPNNTLMFGTVSKNILMLVKLLKKNCVQIKSVLKSMREIVDEAQLNNVDIPDYIYQMYINSERLYVEIMDDIGFIFSVVESCI